MRIFLLSLLLLSSSSLADNGYSDIPAGGGGSAGNTGNTGASGVTGLTGASGASGLSGSSGATGKTGATGATGLSGLTGSSGASGATGATGGTGSSGVASVNTPLYYNSGSQLIGFTGSTGDTFYMSAPNTYTAIPAGVQGQLWRQGASSVPGWEYPTNITKNGIDLFDDFDDGNNGGTFLTSATNGTGSVSAYLGGSITNQALRRLDTGTTTSGYSFLLRNSSDPYLLTGGYWVFQTILKLTNLSDATDTFWAQTGLYANLASATVNDGCLFRYSHGNNSGKWEAECNNNGGGPTLVDTGIAADTNFHNFLIIINDAGTSATFYIDQVLVATITTNLPGATRRINISIGILKTAGTTSRRMELDAFSLFMRYTTNR